MPAFNVPSQFPKKDKVLAAKPMKTTTMLFTKRSFSSCYSE